MKTNEEPKMVQEQTNTKSRFSTFANLPAKSVRPQRSMVKVQSLRPKRIVVATKTKKAND